MRDVLSCAVAAVIVMQTAGADTRSMLGDRVMTVTRDSVWTLTASIPVAFKTFHPQGMARIGDAFFVTSVEVTVPTKRFPQPVGGFDRDAGDGIGHLFKIDGRGQLIADVRLGEHSMYHPGGIDYDGKNVWVPVAEYRPNSRSIVYRVDPLTMKATEAFRAADHIGALVHDVDRHALHGVSWGSRRFYRWTLDGDERVTNAGAPVRAINPSHYVDYQDCKFAGSHRMLCTGVTEIRQKPDGAPFRLGGMDLVDLDDGRPLHQVPVLLWTSGGVDMTHNPVWIEATNEGLRGYFMPEDNTSTIYVYEVKTN